MYQTFFNQNILKNEEINFQFKMKKDRHIKGAEKWMKLVIEMRLFVMIIT